MMDASVVEMSLKCRALKIKSRFVPRIFQIKYQINDLFNPFMMGKEAIS